MRGIPWQQTCGLHPAVEGHQWNTSSAAVTTSILNPPELSCSSLRCRSPDQMRKGEKAFSALKKAVSATISWRTLGLNHLRTTHLSEGNILPSFEIKESGG